MDGLLPAKGQPIIIDLGNFDDLIEEATKALSNPTRSVVLRMHLA